MTPPSRPSPGTFAPRRFLALASAALAAAACGPPAGDEGAVGRAGQSGSAGAGAPAQNRPDVAGARGAVVAGHPLAAAEGHRVLRDGGNAVDAAVTMAAALAVLRPHMNGMGGDAFALVYDAGSGEVAALNGSGRAGARATPALFDERGLGEIPEKGPLTVTVPGAVGAWAAALRRFGTLSLAEALAPAIRFAADGFPVSTRLHGDLARYGEELNEAGRAVYLPGGRPPTVGSLLRNRALAASLRTIAREGPEALYGGPLGRRLAAFLEERGGYLGPGDFAEHRSTWTEPVGIDYLGHRVLAVPPNSQGFVLLQQMGMARSFDLREMGRDSDEYFHTLIELKKLAFADRARWLADPAAAELPMDGLLSDDYLAERASLVTDEAATGRRSGIDPLTARERRPEGSGDTVMLMAVDAEGNAVCWIQSLFHAFGSGLLEPETGIVLQNRGALFTLREDHPNRIAPGKRPFHTLMPAMALREGRPSLVFGTPGGDGQSQTLITLFHDVFLFGMTPQQAVEAPRYRSYEDRLVAIEERVPAAVREGLEARGHELDVRSGWTATFGGAGLILVDGASGVLMTGADPRREAYAVAH